MANSIKVLYPRAGDLIQVTGSGGNYFLATMSGTACVSTAPPLEICGRTCDVGSLTSCKTPICVNAQMPTQAGSEYVYYWQVSAVPVKNVSATGAANHAIGKISSLGLDSDPVEFQAANPGAFETALASHHHHHHRRFHRPFYRLRFLTSTLPAFFNTLADLGIHKSKSVKLWRDGREWVSAGELWTLDINGATAVVSTKVPLTDDLSIPQTWTCLRFHPIHGGDFHPDAITSGGGPLIPIVLNVS